MTHPILLLNAGGTPSIQQGLLSDIPESGEAGRLFIDTTSNVIYRDTGLDWVTLGASVGSVTSPVLQTQSVEVRQSTFSNQIISFDDSVPESDEGALYASITINKSAGTKIIGRFNAWFDTSSKNVTVVMASFRDKTCIDAVASTSSSSGRPMSLALSFSDSPDAGTYTYTVRIGSDSYTTIYVNQSRSADLGKVSQSLFSLQEVAIDSGLLGDIL